MVKFSELKKGDKIMHSHLGTSPAVSGIIMESPKQGRGVKSTILVDVKGSEEISSEFHSELIPDPILWMIAHTPHSVGSGIRNYE